MGIEKLGFISWILTFITWYIAYQISKGSTKRTEINKAIDRFNELVMKAEDLALDFWVQNDSKILEYQLSLILKRASNAAQAVVRLSPEQNFPSNDFKEYRKNITLNTESKGSVNQSQQGKAVRIMAYSSKLQDHFTKTI